MHSVNVEIEVDLPDGVTVRGYERHRAAHVFEIDFDLPQRFTCAKCQRESNTNVRLKDEVLPVRDLDLFGQPSFWVFQPALHQCPHCRQRTQIPAPFKRPRTTYTCRFEEHVLELLVGLSVEEVARRLGCSAEMVEAILEHRLTDERTIPSEAVITSIGLDELSLKKRHKLYVTIMTDLSSEEHPRVLAVVKGRDRAAAEKCLGLLSPEQRAGVRSHRTDMSAVYPLVCSEQLPNSQLVLDRFHVAKHLGEMVDRVRKKHAVTS